MTARAAIRRLILAATLILAALASPASAAVELGFYSRELGTNFPHAFVVVRGTVDTTGERVDTSYGFTAHTVSPAILFGSVRGEVLDEGADYIARSDRQFAITLSDAQYAAVMRVVQEWRNAPQPSYNLKRHSCVHFVAAIAQAIGLRVETPQRLMNRPRSYLQFLASLNPQLAGATPTTAARQVP